MSTTVPGQIIPRLQDDKGQGRGKLDRAFRTRQTSGTETGEAIGDLSIVHPIASREEMEIVDEWLPGALGMWDAAHGEGSDGHRNQEWRPKETDVSLTVSDADGGSKLYEGPAEIKRAVVRVSEKAAVVTIFLRLHGPPATSVADVFSKLGRAVDYSYQTVEVEGSTKPGNQEGGLPFGARPEAGRPNVGDVVVAMDLDEPGRVLSVSDSGSVMLSPDVITGEGPSRETTLANVIGVHPICGPKGGKPDGAVARLLDDAKAAGVEVCWGHVIDSLTDLAERGVVVRGPTGWPITSDVIEDVIHRAKAEDSSTGDDLPPEA